MDAEFALRVLAGLYALGAAGTAAYWIAFLTGSARTSDEAGYLDFERSFLMADAYLVAMSGGAAIACWHRKPTALALGLMSSSGWIFLGLMDTLYNLQHRKYRDGGGPMAVETFINAVSLLGGALGARTLWSARAALRQPVKARG